MPRRLSTLLTCVAAAAVATAVLSVGAVTAGAAQAPPEVEIGSVDPPAGPAGTEVAYTLSGTDAAGSQECATSSAYRLELLAPDGTLAATGGETVAVPAEAVPGDSFIRLVCYVPDATGRRVIYGLCASFVVTQPGEAATPEPGTVAADCPATPRLSFGQSVIAVERAFSEAFNPLLFYPLPE